MSARRMNAHPSTEPISQIIRVRLTEEATSWGHGGAQVTLPWWPRSTQIRPAHPWLLPGRYCLL